MILSSVPLHASCCGIALADLARNLLNNLPLPSINEQASEYFANPLLLQSTLTCSTHLRTPTPPPRLLYSGRSTVLLVATLCSSTATLSTSDTTNGMSTNNPIDRILLVLTEWLSTSLAAFVSLLNGIRMVTSYHDMPIRPWNSDLALISVRS